MKLMKHSILSACLETADGSTAFAPAPPKIHHIPLRGPPASRTHSFEKKKNKYTKTHVFQ